MQILVHYPFEPDQLEEFQQVGARHGHTVVCVSDDASAIAAAPDTEVILGGFTPAISTYLIHVTGNRAIPGLWLSLAAACSLVAAFSAKPDAADPVDGGRGTLDAGRAAEQVSGRH